MSDSIRDPIYEEEALGKAYDARLLRRLWHYVAPYRWQVILTLGLVGPLFVLEVAPAWIIKHGLEIGLGEGGEGGAFSGPLTAPDGVGPFVWLAGLYLLATVLSAGLHYVHGVLMATTGQSAMRDLRSEVFDHIQKLHLGFFDRYPVGRLVTRATNDVENVAEMFSAGIVALV
ncbi:MAG: ABC transporter transmembrane domain-containing protein, partial [Proteobacteria bacterium]|nr:ABC transporter transmembrane domain-containing protein [Pseudomonadota bacterium]